MNGPTADEIRAWPATVDLATGGSALGLSRSYSYELQRRGEFPIRTLKVGGKTRVITADLMRLLDITPNAEAAGSADPTAAYPTPSKDNHAHGNPARHLRAAGH